MDAKILIAAADLGMQKAASLRLAGKAFDVDDFLTRVVRNLSNPHPTTQTPNSDMDIPVIDWYALGDIAARSMCRVPTIDYMYETQFIYICICLKLTL